MTTPDDRKSLKVSPDIHAGIMDLAAQLDGTADDALRHLLGMSTIRVPVSPVQRQRWTTAAESAGVSVDELVRLRMEASLHGPDRETLNQVFYRVDALCRAAGIAPPRRLVDGP